MEKKHTTAIIVIAALVITTGAVLFIANKKKKAKLATGPDTFTYTDENGNQQVMQKDYSSNPVGDFIDKLFTKKSENSNGSKDTSAIDDGGTSEQQGG